MDGYIITPHAEFEMRRRGITEEDLWKVVATPEQEIDDDTNPGRVIRQSRIGNYLLRVFVDIDRTPADIVTVYRTSKIGKYWRGPL